MAVERKIFWFTFVFPSGPAFGIAGILTRV